MAYETTKPVCPPARSLALFMWLEKLYVSFYTSQKLFAGILEPPPSHHFLAIIRSNQILQLMAVCEARKLYVSFYNSQKLFAGMFETSPPPLFFSHYTRHSNPTIDGGR